MKKICNDEKKAIKDYGQVVAEKLFMILGLISSAENLLDICAFPQYRLHKLIGNRNGEYSVYLGSKTGYRLIFTPLDKNEEEIKKQEDMVYAVTVCVKIMEVSKHYE